MSSDEANICTPPVCSFGLPESAPDPFTERAHAGYLLGLEFQPCDTRLYRTLQTRPEKHVTEASPTVACQRAHAKRTTVTQCVMLPRHYIAPTHYPRAVACDDLRPA